MVENTLTVCGLAAVRAIAIETPEFIERLFFDDAHAPLFADTCRYLARERKTYRLVTGDELKKITDTAHHQGAAAVIRRSEAVAIDRAKITSHALCLHDVMNPHNVGAILRTAAFFGVENLYLSAKSFDAAATSAAWRVAEGGLTHANIYRYSTDEEFFAWAKREAARALAAVRPEAKTQRTLGEFIRDKNTSPLVVCFGNEEEGLPAAFTTRCNGRFTISGSGKIESLNVAATAAVCLAQIAEKPRPA